MHHTYITRLIKPGVNPKMAQTLARHQDASLTLNTYSHVEMIDKVAALRQLPPLDGSTTDAQMQAAVATGTDCKKIEDTGEDSQETFAGSVSHTAAGKASVHRSAKAIILSPLGTTWHGVAMGDNKGGESAQGGTRTRTGFLPHGPQPCASTKFRHLGSGGSQTGLDTLSN